MLNSLGVKMNFNCTNCKSEEIRRLSIIHSDGLSRIDTTTSGSSISGGSGGLRAGSNTAKTTGTLQTDLSKKAAPPQKNSYIGAIIAWLIGALLLSWILGWFGLNVSRPDWKGKIYQYASFILLAWWLYKVFVYNRETYPPLKKQWNNSFMCFRCGEVFEVNEQNRTTV